MLNLEGIKQRENNFKRLLQTDEAGRDFFHDNFQEIQRYLSDRKDLIREIERLQDELKAAKPVHLKERKGYITKIAYQGHEYAVIHPTVMRDRARKSK